MSTDIHMFAYQLKAFLHMMIQKGWQVWYLELIILSWACINVWVFIRMTICVRGERQGKERVQREGRGRKAGEEKSAKWRMGREGRGRKECKVKDGKGRQGKEGVQSEGREGKLGGWRRKMGQKGGVEWRKKGEREMKGKWWAQLNTRALKKNLVSL